MSFKNRDLSRTTKQVVMLIDTSGSMNGIPIREIEKAVNLFTAYIGKIDDKKIRYCILEFNERVHVICDWDESNDHNKICLSAYGGTDFGAGLREAKNKIDEEQAKNGRGCEKPALLIITDGYTENLSLKRGVVEAYSELFELYFLCVGGTTNKAIDVFPNIKRIQDITAGSFQEILRYMIDAVETNSKTITPRLAKSTKNGRKSVDF